MYYVTCFLVMVFCNKCPLSILTQVFVSYFCFVTSQSCTISCRQTNHKYSIILDIKRKHNFKHFLLYTYCRNTNPKGEHSSHGDVQSCPLNKKKEFYLHSECFLAANNTTATLKIFF